jgi:hypothetical protein
VALDLAHRHAPGVHRDDLVVEAVEPGFPLGHDLRLEGAVAVARHVIRTIGTARARTKIGLANLVYNMKRMIWLTDRAAPA